MSFFSDLLAKPAKPSAQSNYAVLNGLIYLGLGGMFMLWPGSVQTIFMDPEFAGHEEGLFRVIGMAIAVIGWLYVFGGRADSQQFGPASVLDRLILVPLVLIPLILAGVFPHTFGAFLFLDPALGIGAWILHSRKA